MHSHSNTQPVQPRPEFQPQQQPQQQQQQSTRSLGYVPYGRTDMARGTTPLTHSHGMPNVGHSHSHGQPSQTYAFTNPPSIEGHSHSSPVPHNHSHSLHQFGSHSHSHSRSPNPQVSHNQQNHRNQQNHTPLTHSHGAPQPSSTPGIPPLLPLHRMPSSQANPQASRPPHSHSHSRAVHNHSQNHSHTHGNPGQWYVHPAQVAQPQTSQMQQAMVRAQQVPRTHSHSQLQHSHSHPHPPHPHLCMMASPLGVLLSRVFLPSSGNQLPFRVIVHPPPHASHQINSEQIEDSSCMFTLEDKEKLPEENKSCAICLESFDNGDTLRTLPCLHFFHPSCVDRWLKENAKCPTCRTDITELERRASELLNVDGDGG
eukprot:TRINITY_DN5697_c0_g1_i1.p1 TRINITY_DN5697_c0_g1~~TRINITY_DN5697_c0_g1_i1.p1  ORF type:complete len:371 (+),score=29.45 TRINITY_DN5697_c0_g1_i1:201-1313(+)